MAGRTIDKTVDKFIVMLFFISISIMMYYSSLSQSENKDGIAAPVYILLLPFAVAILQYLRVLMLIRSCRIDSLFKSWLYIFLYYIVAFLLGVIFGHKIIDYYVVWFMLCPPAAWLYYSLIIKANPIIIEYLVKWSFLFLLLFSCISLYFIPRSIRSNGIFLSLNTGYYVLFIYPLVMLNNNKKKKTIATLLMIVVVILSMKRGGYAALALSFVLYLLFATKISVYKKTIVFLICVGVLVFAIPKIDEMTNGTLTTRYEFSQRGGDEEGRVEIYSSVWKAVLRSDAFDLVFGHGLNAVINDKAVSGRAAHNDYLEFLYDYGIIGLLLLLNYNWQLLLITIRSRKSKDLFYPAIFALTTIIVLSMVAIVYAFYYFLLIIPFWCIAKQSQTIGTNKRLTI